MRLPAAMIFTLLILYTGRSTAQDLNERDFIAYTMKDGLSSDDINSIVQDTVGFIWAATPLGLNRYNGSRFIQFHSNDDSLSLPGEYIKKLMWLDDHRLAIITGTGLQVFNTATG